MNFYDKDIIKTSKYFQQVLKVLKEYKIQGYFGNKDGLYEAYPQESKIYVSLKEGKYRDSIREFLSSVCHEIGHVLCYRRGKYKSYNGCGRRVRFTKKRVRLWIRTGYKAEKYADRVGKELMKRYFPKIPYNPGYGTKESYIWYHKNYLDAFYKFLKGDITFND